MCIELRPRGRVPVGGSTSTLFFQDITGRRHLRLDYGYNVQTRTIDYHWNQRGTHGNFGIPDHTPAGPAGEAAYTAARYFRYAGRVLIVDMAPHHREEYRQQMGHVWLGFSEDQAKKFLTQAGFDRVKVTTLPEDPGARGPGLFVATGRKKA